MSVPGRLPPGAGAEEAGTSVRQQPLPIPPLPAGSRPAAEDCPAPTAGCRAAKTLFSSRNLPLIPFIKRVYLLRAAKKRRSRRRKPCFSAANRDMMSTFAKTSVSGDECRKTVRNQRKKPDESVDFDFNNPERNSWRFPGRMVDLALFTDAETGLCVVGSVWLRYAALAVVLLLAVAAGRAAKPEASAAQPL